MQILKKDLSCRFFMSAALILSMSFVSKVNALQNNFSDSVQIKTNAKALPITDSLYKSLFKVTPEVLELVNDTETGVGKIPVTITGSFPDICSDQNIKGVIIPVLKDKKSKYIDKELVNYNREELGDSIEFHGSNVVGSGINIGQKGNTNFTINTSFRYKFFNYYRDFRRCELFLRFKTTVNGKDSLLIPDIKLADGLSATISLFREQIALTPLYSLGKFYGKVHETSNVDIMVDHEATDITPEDWKSDKFDYWLDFVKLYNGNSYKSSHLHVVITSYMLPDKKYSISGKLAAKKGNNVRKSLKEYFEKNNIKAKISTKVVRREWSDVKKLIEKSSWRKNDTIIRQLIDLKYISGQTEFSAQNIPDEYIHYVDSILPLLQFVNLDADYSTSGKSDEKIYDAIEREAYKDLSLDELLYAPLLPIRLYPQIWNWAKDNYPNDYRIWNNIAAYYLSPDKHGYQDKEVTYNDLLKAAELAPETAELRVNEAIFAAYDNNGNIGAAERYLNEAAKANKSYKKENLNKLFQLTNMNPIDELWGMFYLKKGDYKKASEAFGDNRTNNAALAHIMNKDYLKAKKALYYRHSERGLYSGNGSIYDCTSSDKSIAYYLKAILAARTNTDASNEKDIFWLLMEVTKLARIPSACECHGEGLIYDALNDIEFENRLSPLDQSMLEMVSRPIIQFSM